MDSSLFPYAFREQQEEFFEFVQGEVAKGRNVIVEAATGFGKTPLILSALLPEAISRGLRILWTVRTGTETDRPIEELKAIRRRRELKGLFGLSYRGKRDMCLLLRDLRLEGTLSHEDANLVCEAYREKCPYRLNLKALWEGSLETLVEEPRLYSETLSLCSKRRVCPYGAQLLLLDFASLVSLSYNYILDPRIRSFMRSRIGFRDSILVVDEAHNLQQAAGELNSDRITTRTIERSLNEAKVLEGQGREIEVLGFLESLRDRLRGLYEKIEGEEVFDLEKFAQGCAGGMEAFMELAEEARILGRRIRRRLLRDGKAPRSSLYHLGEFWTKALELRTTEGVAMVASKEAEGSLSVELFDMRSSELLGRLWDDFEACIFCSGTLKPLGSFAEVIGLQNHVGRVFPSPYPEENVASFITRGLSTRGEELSDGMAKAYLEALEAFLGSLKANVAIFSSSYRVQERLLSLGLKAMVEERRRRLFVEDQGLSGDEGRRILEEFKACAPEGGGRESPGGVLCGVMGGRFAEGADFPGRELEAIFLVGIPFARPTVRTRLYIEYYTRLYGKGKGREYAYVLPALKRASQALGRALRSREDRAVFILGDERYVRYRDLLPDYVQKTVRVVQGRPEGLMDVLSRVRLLRP